MSLRIVASNLHVGGGVQVAASLIDELVREGLIDANVPSETEIEVSQKVWDNLSPESRAIAPIRKLDRYPFDLRARLADLRRRRTDVVWIIFGPYYFQHRARITVMGYADVTAVTPFSAPGAKSRGRELRRNVRRRISHASLRRADVVVVESQAMAGAVRPWTSHPALVVPNAVNARIVSAGQAAVNPPCKRTPTAATSDLRLIYPARWYPHKNLEFIPRVASEIGGARKVTFLVTLRPDEWEGASPAFRSACSNLGELTLDRLAEAYRDADGVFFPSLLEANSATPLEALAFGLPLFASDRPFVREVAQDAARYFDPYDPADAARTILDAFSDPTSLNAMITRGREIAAAAPTATDRALTIFRVARRAESAGVRRTEGSK